MKKIIFLSLSAMCFTALVACGGGDDADNRSEYEKKVDAFMVTSAKLADGNPVIKVLETKRVGKELFFIGEFKVDFPRNKVQELKENVKKETCSNEDHLDILAHGYSFIWKIRSQDYRNVYEQKITYQTCS